MALHWLFHPLRGVFLVRILVLVGVSRGSAEPFFRVPGRGGHLVGPATKWGGRGRPAGHAAVPPATGGAVLTFAPGGSGGAVFFQGGSLRDKWLDRAGVVRPSRARKN